MANIQSAQRDTITINRNGTKVEGIATDRNGNAIAGARVVLTNARTKKQEIITTDRFGNYSVELDAEVDDQILVHAEFKRGGNIVVIKGVAVLTKEDSSGQVQFELLENEAAVKLLAKFETSVARILVDSAADEPSAVTRKKREEVGA